MQKTTTADISAAVKKTLTSRDYSVQVHMQSARMTEDPSMRNVWYGNETRTTEDGTQWSRQIGHMVQDDFGFLVKVPA